MPAKKGGSPGTSQRDNITISIKGNSNAVAAGSGAKANIQQIGSQAELATWRKHMEQQISMLQGLAAEDKALLNTQVGHIEAEVAKGTTADLTRLERLINTLGVMAPDILEVAVTTLINPLAGIGLVVKKVGDKARVQKKV